MAELITPIESTTPPVTPPEPTTPPVTPPADGPPETWVEVFQHTRFKELNERAKTAEDALAKIEASQKRANDEALKKRAEYKTLYEQAQAELETERQSHLRLTVATLAGLPTELAGRLVGSTQEEMEADAAKLQKLVKPSAGPGQTPPAKSTPTKALDFDTMTPAEVRDASKGKAINELFKPAA